jgi:hypothetical protein
MRLRALASNPVQVAAPATALLVAFLLLGTAFLAPRPALASATITIVNADGAGEGFNDPTPATPIGGNPGTTIGAQRLFVFQYAAKVWGQLLKSNVTILVHANFDPQTCDSVSGVLGSAGPTTALANFSGAIFTNTWYHPALANKLAGTDLSPSTNDINATFNSSVGGTNCLRPGWYYGIDGNEGSQIELLPVVLHELGHGLGFSTNTNGQTGAQLGTPPPGFPSAFDHFLYSPSLNLHWNQMSNSQRASNSISCGDLTWDGPLTTNRAVQYLGPGPNLRVNTPPAAAGNYEVGEADFGPPLDQTGVTGNVVIANDGVGVTSNACEPIINVVAGKIVIIDRGGCTFVTKVKNAQNAGAIGVVVADSVAGCPPAGMGGSDPTITIPSVRVTQADGAKLKANVTGMNVTMSVDPTIHAGTGAGGRVLMYAANPYQSGSNVSHWDVSATPNLLMEPIINSDLSQDVDLTMQAFGDLGWFGATGVAEQEMALNGFSLAQNEPNPGSVQTSVRFHLPTQEEVSLRVYDVNGRLVQTPVEGVLESGYHTATIVTKGLPGGVYFYKLQAADGKSLSKRLVVIR